ncbi:MAG: uracil-DNA glycosylase [Oscillospiraceae bacterium]|nr:uracil-DNA glycosylase [Oscillospiraceae bacterium]
MTDSFDQLKQDCSQCMRCSLGSTRHHLVFGVGNEHAPIVFIGEGPGEKEDLQGVPFVGPAGQLLDVMLQLVGLDRTKVYICNIVKCRPPLNRDPSPEERDACSEWLQRQITLIDPKILVCLGRISATTLIDSAFRITRDHGKWYERDGRQIIATFHPSALLRDPSKRPEAFADFREIRAALRTLQPDCLERNISL